MLTIPGYSRTALAVASTVAMASASFLLAAAPAGAAEMAKVTGHSAFSAEDYKPSAWCVDYSLVVVKAGAGGKDGDRAISHIILCDVVTPEVEDPKPEDPRVVAVNASDCVAILGSDMVQVVVTNTGNVARTYRLVNGSITIDGAELAPAATARHEVAVAGSWTLTVDGQADSSALTDPKQCGAIIGSEEDPQESEDTSEQTPVVVPVVAPAPAPAAEVVVAGDEESAPTTTAVAGTETLAKTGMATGPAALGAVFVPAGAVLMGARRSPWVQPPVSPRAAR